MLHPAIKVRDSGIEGKGLIATEFIPKGTIIWTMDGSEKWYTFEELQKLPIEEQKYAYQQDDQFVIVTDGSQYMNHSCDPNTNGLDDDKQIVIRDIQPGDEVTYDYATVEVDERFRPRWECRCGAPNCRKVITNRDCLDLEFQKKYWDGLPNKTREFIRLNQKA
jgi:uncharacterized protein